MSRSDHKFAAGADGGGLLQTTIRWRSVSPGMRLTAASVWFQYRPDRWTDLQEGQHAPSSPSSLSEDLTDSGDSSTTADSQGANALALSAMCVKETSGGCLDPGEDIGTKPGVSSAATARETANSEQGQDSSEEELEAEIPAVEEFPSDAISATHSCHC